MFKIKKLDVKFMKKLKKNRYRKDNYIRNKITVLTFVKLRIKCIKKLVRNKIHQKLKN